MSAPVPQIFRLGVAVLPVIHLTDVAAAAEDAALADEAGADGVFLIYHGSSGDGPMATMYAAEIAYAALSQAMLRRGAQRDEPWVGVNLLGLDAGVAASRALSSVYVRGLWSDPAPRQAERFRPEEAERFRSEPALLFAGVAFKGQRPRGTIEDEAWAAIESGVDVLTTSGPGTGFACDPEKVRRIRAVIEQRDRGLRDGADVRIGVASGVSAGNVVALVEAGADALLVASSIARDDGSDRLDPEKLRALIRAVEATGKRATRS